MRLSLLAVLCAVGWAQEPDPAYAPLGRAYEALKTRDYEAAIHSFRQAAEAAPKRPAIRKDLAYTYLKIGENLAARDAFYEAMRLDPADLHVAMEYAFLCYETKEQAQARRIFDRIRKTGDAIAEQAFQNIDRPLRQGIERWKKALQAAGPNFSSHFELATLAEQRDEWDLAAEHYEKAWRLQPARRGVLVNLGRVWKNLNRLEEANSAWLAASRGGEARTAETARELLPDRYPYVPEFRKALELDPQNHELRRDLAYLLLKMGRQQDAEAEFQRLTAEVPSDLLSAAQLGFLLLARNERVAAMPLLQRVLEGADEELANRVRAVLRLPQVLRKRSEDHPLSIDARLMAERSIKAGFIKDALKYLQIAHEDDPADFDVMLKLGWANNVLRRDETAYRWFDLARRSPDPRVAGEAGGAFSRLRPAVLRVRLSAWMFPVYSSRWRDTFSYGQVKAEFRLAGPFVPYASVRFVGDTRLSVGAVSPIYLSESAFIPAAGVAWKGWRGLRGWFEAGGAASYATRTFRSDYRGGFNFMRGFGRQLGSEASGWFVEAGADAIFVSRFGNDFLAYSQNRAGYTFADGAWRAQVYWSGNLTGDAKREYWANFVETGPGVRFRGPLMPASMYVSVNLLRGAYTHNTENPTRPNFNDLRVGIWYALAY